MKKILFVLVVLVFTAPAWSEVDKSELVMASTCYQGQPDESQWNLLGQPECWCYPRQCLGDTDGLPYGKQNYYVSIPDLKVLKAAWGKTTSQILGQREPTTGVLLACADLDHLPYGILQHRVSLPDLTILIAYWTIGGGPSPGCQPGTVNPAPASLASGAISLEGPTTVNAGQTMYIGINNMDGGDYLVYIKVSKLSEGGFSMIDPQLTSLAGDLSEAGAAYDDTDGREIEVTLAQSSGSSTPGVQFIWNLTCLNNNVPIIVQLWDAANLNSPVDELIINRRNIVFVDADANGANNGTSWTDAFLYLQDALSQANSNPDVNEILVSEGIYKPDVNSSNPGGTSERGASFRLINGVTIKGGYAGVSEPDPNARDIKLYKTILSGDVNAPGDSNDNSYHVVTGVGTEPNAILEGFAITAGNANGPTYYDKRGGGLYNQDGSPTVINCIFLENSAGAGAGMLNDYECSPTIINCAFIGNSAEQYGGGMHNYGLYSQNEQTLINCTFSCNTAGIGGGISNWDGSTPTLTNCILWGNSDNGGYDESAQISESNSITTINYSCVQGWTGSFGGMGNIGDDPLFKDADGMDDIMGTEDDDLRLSAGSPCIDAADSSMLLAVPVYFDIAFKDRYVDIDTIDDTGSGPWEFLDMGAYEFHCSGIPGDINCDGVVDSKDLAIFCNNWLLGAGT